MADANGKGAASAKPMLEAEDLDFSYGRLQVLFGVSLHVDRGEALALLGTNGAGKSTLLRVLAGLEAPNGGRVWLDGADVTATEAEDLVSGGLVLVPGGRAVFPDMTVDENLELQAITVRRRTDWVRERRDRIYDLWAIFVRARPELFVG